MKLFGQTFIMLFTVGCLALSCEGTRKKASPEATSQKIDSLIRSKVTEKSKPQPVPKKKDTNSFVKLSDANVEQRLLSYGKKNPETIVDIYTSKGKVRARLYKSTPLHRANFILLAKKEFYKGSVFTRVTPNFIAQGGGTYNKAQVEVKKSIGSYTIPNEISKKHFHKRGALGAARRYNFNPEKRSDPYAFYFVEGNTYNNPTLDEYERLNKYTYPAAHREFYNHTPGAAHIDGQHTVFGEIISGFEVIPKITAVRRDSRDWPIEDIYIDSVKVIR